MDSMGTELTGAKTRPRTHTGKGGSEAFYTSVDSKIQVKRSSGWSEYR
jgi:hypothetical protein